MGGKALRQKGIDTERNWNGFESYRIKGFPNSYNNHFETQG